MRGVIVDEWMTLEGVVQGPGYADEDTDGGFEHGGWHLRYFDDISRKWVVEGYAEAGGFLLERRTYENLAAYWPTASDEEQVIAKPLNTLPKYVASRTLTEPLEWQNSTVLRGRRRRRQAPLPRWQYVQAAAARREPGDGDGRDHRNLRDCRGLTSPASLNAAETTPLHSSSMSGFDEGACGLLDGGMHTLAAQQTFAEWMRDHGVRILLVVVVALVVTLLARVAVHRFERRLAGPADATQTIGLRRVATLTHALSTATVVLIWAIAFLMVLDQFDVNLAPLLASAGIAGVALGFGAQSLVRDGLSGFFILLENQLGVGDTVDLQTIGGAVSGKVEALTLRVTVVRAFDGTLNTVPNGNITIVSNRSRGWARAIVDVRVTYGEDVDRLREVLDELFAEVRVDQTLSDWIREGPTVLGIDALSADAKVLRVVADTRTSKRMDVERHLRELIAQRFAERKIHVPVSPPPPVPGPPARPAA